MLFSDKRRVAVARAAARLQLVCTWGVKKEAWGDIGRVVALPLAERVFAGWCPRGRLWDCQMGQCWTRGPSRRGLWHGRGGEGHLLALVAARGGERSAVVGGS